MRRLVQLGAAGSAALLLLAGCTGTSQKSANSGAPPSAAGSAAGSTAASAGSGGAASQATSAPDLPPRSLAKTAGLTVRVADVNAQAQRAVRVATSAGGDVLTDRRSGEGVHATADLTLEVPPNSLERDLDLLAALGEQVDRSTNTDDVTQQVVDVTSRLSSMRVSLARVRSLYAKAGSIGDVIRLESELASRQANLESLEAQQQDLARQTARATIHLQLLAKRAVAAPVAAKHASGVSGGFTRGWHAFTVFVRWTVIAFGAVLPFLLVVAAAGALVVWWRRRKPTSGDPATPPPPAGT
ncbi:MAG TPA: DUF4349 domain-containing protein [Jatrophihabitantaceae bacterium]|jgi:hypothetical protein